jgi:hypothetical protein
MATSKRVWFVFLVVVTSRLISSLTWIVSNSIVGPSIGLYLLHLVRASLSFAVPWEEDEDEMAVDPSAGIPPSIVSEFNDVQKHQLRHRELFLTRQIETLLATNIRGKCLVTLHNETESFLSYLNAEVCSSR